MSLPPKQRVSPLNWREPIVNPDGTPSQQFIRLWQTMFGNGENVDAEMQQLIDAQLQAGSGIAITPDGHLLSNPTIAAEVQPILDQITDVHGSVLYRDSTGWAHLPPGTAGEFLQTQGAGADPLWATAGGGGGGLTLISRTVTTGSATNVNFSSIPSSYEDLIVVISGRGTRAATLVDIRARVNGDTGGNYDIETQQTNNTTNSGFASVAQTSWYVGNVAAASAPVNVSDNIEFRITAYARTTFQKSGYYTGTLKTSNAAAGLYTERGSLWWRSTAAINSLDVFPSANAFVDGTVVSLYGRA